ncbi:hypothetical protein [Spirosoma foliorum]|uniref:Uncharacterized protein n=1 Tax=Spirosoma foliorum TaxID=2710596 RepID=A0A7G5GV07_9BACT|nr:hypothetical protein [Spirosoma foliorum]QMW02699.1 hypothetical protein H3H32_33165 [Spirosoma foliorum]
MKKMQMAIAVVLLTGTLQAWAQSGNTQTPNNSQIESKGASNNKDAKQKSKTIPKRADHPVPASSVGTGVDAAANPNSSVSPGSHTAQRETKMDYKANGKGKSKLKGKQ